MAPWYGEVVFRLCPGQETECVDSFLDPVEFQVLKSAGKKKFSQSKPYLFCRLDARFC